MWESCLYGSVRGRKTTVVWKRCCGTVAKAGGNRENKHLPAALGGSCLLESWSGSLLPECVPVGVPVIVGSQHSQGQHVFCILWFPPSSGTF